MKKAVLVFGLLLLAGVVTVPGVCADEPAPADSVAADTKTPVLPAPCIVPATRVLHPRMVDMLAARLSLTEDQKRSITDLLTRAEEDIVPIVEAQQAAAKDFVQAFGSAKTTESELAAASERALKAESAIMTERIKTLFALRALLNADQNAGFSALLEQYTSPWRAHGERPRVTPPRGSAPLSEDNVEDRR